MQAKKMGYFLTLLLFSGLIYSVGASTTTVSFRGGGVTVDLTFPEEAHPTETLTHNVTITAHTDLSLQSFTLFIYAPVNATWQEVKNRTISWDFLENETLTSRIEFQLPQDTNGTLYCEMTVQTDQTADALSYKFYTTRVSELTFSEMQNLYYEMLANYTSLQADYQSLLNEYNDLLANYTSLFANYTALLSEHNDLLTEYNTLDSNYRSKLNEYNALQTDYNTLDSNYRSQLSKYNALQADYSELNSTHYSLQANYTSLQTVYNALNKTYAELQTELANLQERITSSENALNSDRIVMFIFIVTVACLIAFIIYIKRKEPEPYVVIRKETVTMKPDEKT
jgi:FtsZ-binding cell division protein ZapB